MTGEDPDSRYAFTLPDGRVIRLLSLEQWWTYQGLLAGRPNRALNRRLLDGLVAKYTASRGDGAPVLLEPLQTPVELEPSSPGDGDGDGDGDEATLPFAVCVARFRSAPLPGDDVGIASVLRVIWFQDDFAFPIDPGIQAELAALDWDAHATSWMP